MPSFMGGMLVEDETLRASLKGVLDSFARKRPNNPDGLVGALVQCEAAFRLEQEYALHANPWLSVEKYLKALRAARLAYLEIPNQLQGAMTTFLPYTGSSLLPDEVLKGLFVRIYGDSSRAGLPAWRLDGLESHDYWGLDLEMLDLLIAAAAKMIDECGCDPYTRARPDFYLAKWVTDVCVSFGIKKSAAESSQLYRIVSAVLRNKYPKASYKSLIKEVIRDKG